MKSKLMNFDGAKALTTKEQKMIIGGCGCNGNGTGGYSDDPGPRCHMC